MYSPIRPRKRIISPEKKQIATIIDDHPMAVAGEVSFLIMIAITPIKLISDSRSPTCVASLSGAME